VPASTNTNSSSITTDAVTTITLINQISSTSPPNKKFCHLARKLCSSSVATNINNNTITVET
jgi:hypothetical protein